MKNSHVVNEGICDKIRGFMWNLARFILKIARFYKIEAKWEIGGCYA